MNKKLLTCSLIVISIPFFFGCSGPVKGENKNNVSVSSLPLHVGDEKYFTVDTKESVVTWTGTGAHGKHVGYAYISKGEVMIDPE